MMNNLYFQLDGDKSAFVRLVSKISRIMKLTLFLVCLSISMSFAMTTNAQSTSLSFKATDQSIKEVLELIESQTDFHFFYNSKLVDINQVISVDIKDKDVFTTLDHIFENSNIRYKIVGKDVILSVKGSKSDQNEKTVTGTVVDETGEPIIGANIVEKGKANGTMSDLNGHFSIVVSSDAVLQISYIGFSLHEEAVKNKNVLQVIMKEDTQKLDEVVVVGYGSVDKKELTSAVTAVSSKDFLQGAFTSPLSMIDGKVSGVNVSNAAAASSAGGWKNGFLVQPSDDISLGTGDKDVSGTKTEGRSLSQFARVNYAYDDRYLLEASIRRDGYDNFGPENRFGVFPSASVGWNVGKESFVKDNITWMSQLKLRGSYGKIGNNTIPQFLYEPSFTNNYLYYSYDGQNTQRGFWYSNVANATIKWEDVAQWNIGVDASFLDNRLNTTIEYYDKKTSDMLYSVGVPPSAGPSSEPFSETSSYRANIGKISNRGFEWMVQWRDSYKDFRYDVAFTLSTNKNKVVKLSDQVNPIIWAGSDAALNSSIYRTENGQPMGQMYGYVVDGIIQDQAEIDALNAQSPDGLYQQAGTAPGDLKYKDLNGDGKVTNEDKTYIGNPWPDLMYGLNINLSWKGFDLSMGWLGNAGVDVFNSAKLYERSFYGDYNTTYKVYEAWSPTNRATSHPRVTKEDPNGNFKNVSSYFVEDGSFFKLKNLHFGYNLPKSILSHLKIEGLKFYINCDNLFIITKFQGDPELGGGYLERNMYSVKRAPSTRTIMGGLSLTL